MAPTRVKGALGLDEARRQETVGVSNSMRNVLSSLRLACGSGATARVGRRSSGAVPCANARIIVCASLLGGPFAATLMHGALLPFVVVMLGLVSGRAESGDLPERPSSARQQGRSTARCWRAWSWPLPIRRLPISGSPLPCSGRCMPRSSPARRSRSAPGCCWLSLCFARPRALTGLLYWPEPSAPSRPCGAAFPSRPASSPIRPTG